MNQLEIYTDGSFLFPSDKRYYSPDAIGAWAYVLVFKDKIIQRSGILGKSLDQKSTINRCEFFAIISALTAVLKNDHIVHFDKIIVKSDSQCALAWARKIKPGKYARDLIPLMVNLRNEFENIGTELQLEWVKGHSNNKYNDLADQLANKRLEEVYGVASC